MEREVKKGFWAATLAILSILSFNTPVKAAEFEETLPDAFEIFDKNGDGYITRYEGPLMFNWRPGLFDLEDLNNDAQISRNEFNDWRNAPRTAELVRQVGAQS